MVLFCLWTRQINSSSYFRTALTYELQDEEKYFMAVREMCLSDLARSKENSWGFLCMHLRMPQYNPCFKWAPHQKQKTVNNIMKLPTRGSWTLVKAPACVMMSFFDANMETRDRQAKKFINKMLIIKHWFILKFLILCKVSQAKLSTTHFFLPVIKQLTLGKWDLKG